MKNFKQLMFLLTGLIVFSCSSQTKDSVNKTLPAEKKHVTKEAMEEEEPLTPKQMAIHDSLQAIEAGYELRKPEYFIKNIYEPAMKQKNISAQNIAFLKRLKFFLECPTDSCNRGSFILPVYSFPDNTLRYRRSLDSEYELKKEDTILNASEKKKQYKLYYAKSKKVENCKLTKFVPTTYAPTFVLRKTKSQDTLEPVFISEFDLDLDYRKNEKLDSLLEDDWSKRNSKSWGIAQVYEFSFAQLKNVPGMYFYYGTGEAYTRGIAIIVDDRPLLLWHTWCHERTFETN